RRGIRHGRGRTRSRDRHRRTTAGGPEGAAAAHLRCAHERGADDSAAGGEPVPDRGRLGDLGAGPRRTPRHRPAVTGITGTLPARRDRKAGFMDRYITITLTKAGVTCRARLLDAEAP